jgi:hypothetical protein
MATARPVASQFRFALAAADAAAWRQNGTREMVEVIKLGKKHGHDHLRIAVEAAGELGCADSGAILYLLDTEKLKRKNPELMDVGELARYERPMPKMNDYDLLLKAVTQ